jgi:hypothetical protein
MALSAETKSDTCQSNLQSSLAAVDIDEGVLVRMLFDYRRNLI